MSPTGTSGPVRSAVGQIGSLGLPTPSAILTTVCGSGIVGLAKRRVPTGRVMEL